jgi:phage major head subunit gpT-like protein
MPVANSDVTDFIGPVLRNDFYEAYYQALDGADQRGVDLLSSTIAVSGNTAKFPFAGDIPQMSRWSDERAYDAFSTYSYSVTLGDPWEETVAIKRTALRDDLTGQLRQRARDLGAVAISNRLKQIISSLETGISNKCYDSQNFFATSHPARSTDGTSTTYGNSGTSALDAASLQDTVQTMRLFTSDQGHPLGITPSHLLVGPNLEWRARQLLESPVVIVNVGDSAVGSGATAATPYKNVLVSTLELIVSPWIGNFHWYVMDLMKPIKPVVLVTEMGELIEFQYLEEGSEHSFKRDEFVFGVRDRFEIGYGLWQVAYYQGGTA